VEATIAPAAADLDGAEVSKNLQKARAVDFVKANLAKKWGKK
jgi:hypothetical protein